jgi:ParB family chromosome partitioning protein
LHAEIRTALSDGALTMGHARALLSLTEEAAQRRVGRDVIARGLSVRETEALVRHETTPKADVAEALKPKVDPNTRAAEDQLKLALGTRVRIVRKGKGGRIEVDFANEPELQRLFEKLTES